LQNHDALLEHANAHLHSSEGFFYVLQFEFDLLLAPIVRCDDAGLVLVDGPINPEAITRVWLADRSSNGGAAGLFTKVHPPSGAFGS
jgi:hypothetical protein